MGGIGVLLVRVSDTQPAQCLPTRLSPCDLKMTHGWGPENRICPEGPLRGGARDDGSPQADAVAGHPLSPTRRAPGARVYQQCNYPHSAQGCTPTAVGPVGKQSCREKTHPGCNGPGACLVGSERRLASASHLCFFVFKTSFHFIYAGAQPPPDAQTAVGEHLRVSFAG